jgi:hypothetical protein
MIKLSEAREITPYKWVHPDEDYTRLSKQIAAAAIFGSSINRSAKLVALPADLIPRFEAAQERVDLLNTL